MRGATSFISDHFRKPMTSQLSISILLLMAPGDTFVVDPETADGKQSFLTIQQGLDILKPGDVCVIRAGKYRESVVWQHSATAARPTIVSAEPGVELSGLDRLTTGWARDDDGIFEAVVTLPVRQLFIDGQLMTPARWPDMSFRDRWADDTFRASAVGTRLGLMVDPALAASNRDWSGAMAVLNVGSFQTFRRRILQFNPGNDHFRYLVNPNERLGGAGKHPVGMDRYCLFGRAALDHPGEWFYDAERKRLLVIPPEGVNLAEAVVETRVRDEVFVLKDSRHVKLSGFDVTGSVVQLENCRDCELSDVHFTYAACIANPFGENLPHESLVSPRWNSRRWFKESSLTSLIEITGQNNVVRNCSVRWSEGPAMTFGGEGHLLENCLLHDNDWHGLDYGFGLDCLAAKGMNIRRLTMFNAGGSEGVRLANHGKSLVELSHLHHLGLRQSDGSCVQLSGDGIRGSEIRFNWIHDHNAFHWGGTGLRADDGSRGVHFHHNVVWNCRHKGIVTKGDEHRVHHNTCFDNPEHDILIPRDPLPGKPDEIREQNHHSVVQHNLGKVAGNWIWQKPAEPFAAVKGNRDVATRELRDPLTWDFRLKEDAAEVPGAYGDQADYWMAGCVNSVRAMNGEIQFRLPTFADDDVQLDIGAATTRVKIRSGGRMIKLALPRAESCRISSQHLGQATITAGPESMWTSFDRPMLPEKPY